MLVNKSGTRNSISMLTVTITPIALSLVALSHGGHTAFSVAPPPAQYCDEVSGKDACADPTPWTYRAVDSTVCALPTLGSAGDDQIEHSTQVRPL